MDNLTWIPFANLFFEATGTGDIIYKVLQVLAALKIVGNLGAWIASKTETKADDKFFATATRMIGRAISSISDLASANTRPPISRPTGRPTSRPTSRQEGGALGAPQRHV